MTKKLVVLAPAFFPRNGGVEKHLKMIFRQLIQRGYQIQVLVRYSPDFPRHQLVEGVEVWRMPKRLSGPFLLAWYITHPRIFRGVTAIHSHDFYLPRLHKWLSGVRWVHTFHGYEGYPLQEAAIKSRQQTRSEVAVCYGVGAYIEKWYQTPLDHIIYGAVEPPQQPVAHPNQYDIVFVGRLEDDTGIRQYLEALNQLTRAGSRPTMLVVGGGTLLSDSQDYVSQHNLAVTFHDWVPEVMDYIPRGRVLCAGGYLSILEGAICARPMIVFYESPIRKDAMESMPIAKDYWLADSVEKIVAAYQDIQKPETAAQVAHAQAWAAKQTWSALADSYASEYEGPSR